MKITLISDLHGHLPEINETDLLLIAGDICPYFNVNLISNQLNWLETHFTYWINKFKFPVVACAGNHDFVFYERKLNIKNLIYLQDNAITINGIKIYGTPWQNRFYDWAFNLNGEEELSKKWNLIPIDTDILVCHSPPYGIGDISSNGVNCGSTTLLDKIKEICPKLVVFGHMHHGRGIYQLNSSTLINASLVNDKYELIHSPIKYEIIKGNFNE